MPPVLAAAIPAVIGAGVAINSANQQRRAADQQAQIADQNAERQLAEQRAARDQTMAVNQRFLSGGGDAFDMLLREFGVQPAQPPAAQGGQPAPNAPNWAAYGASNPDLQAEAAQVSGPGKQFATPEQYYEWHFNRFGQAEGRQAPPVKQPVQEPGKQDAPAQVNYGQPTDEVAPNLLTAARPEAPAAPTFQRPADLAAPTFQRPADLAAPTFQRPQDAAAPTFTRPDSPAAPVFTRPDQPTYAAPQAMAEFKFDPNSLREDAGYKFLQQETANGVNNGYAARGLLKSGGAIKALQDRSAGVADQYLGNVFNRALAGYQANAGQYNADRAFGYNVFSDERNNVNRNAETDYGLQTDAYRFGVNRGDANFESDRSTGLNLWQAQQGRQDRNAETDYGLNTDAYRFGVNRQDQNFNTDRGFQRSERDTRVGNIFQLAGYGMQAAGNVSGAGQTFANNAGNIYGSQANAQADAAAQRAAANAGMWGSIGGAASSLIGGLPFGGGGSGGYRSDLGTVNLGNPQYGNIFAPRVF